MPKRNVAVTKVQITPNSGISLNWGKEQEMPSRGTRAEGGDRGSGRAAEETGQRMNKSARRGQVTPGDRSGVGRSRGVATAGIRSGEGT